MVVDAAPACWDRDAACRQAVINWTPTSTDGTYYSLANNDVHLAADDPNAPHTVVHEPAHSTMDDAFDDDYPPAPNCSPHYIQATSPGCAWTEGFAEWVPAEVYNDPYYRWPSGAELNLETPTWGTAGWGTGDDVEGRVAGALIDITDAANEATGTAGTRADPGPLGHVPIYVSDTFAQFCVARGSTATTSPTARSPQLLPEHDRLQLPRPADSTTRSCPGRRRDAHNFDFDTTSADWSATAIRRRRRQLQPVALRRPQPVAAAEHSSLSGGVDFMAVDCNSRRSATTTRA